jgi:hypothetical protein
MPSEKKHASRVWIYVSIFLVFVVLGMSVLFFQKEIIKGVKDGSFECGEGTVLLSDKTICWQKESSATISSWENAEKYCNELTLADKDDWRLPGAQELASIIVMNKTGIKIDESAFPNTFEKNYWTSSVYNNNPSMHWFIHFSTGYQGFGYNYNSGYAVKCVRDMKII